MKNLIGKEIILTAWVTGYESGNPGQTLQYKPGTVGLVRKFERDALGREYLRVKFQDGREHSIFAHEFILKEEE